MKLIITQSLQSVKKIFFIFLASSTIELIPCKLNKKVTQAPPISFDSCVSEATGEIIQEALFGIDEQLALSCIKNLINFNNDDENIFTAEVSRMIIQPRTFMHAVKNNWHDVAGELLRLCSVINTKLLSGLLSFTDDFGCNALFYAIKNNNIKIATLIIDALENYDLIQKILDAHYNPETECFESKDTCAPCHKPTLLFKVFTCKDFFWRRSALMHALESGSEEIIAYLLQAAKKDSVLFKQLLAEKDKLGHTPLLFATLQNNISAVQLIISFLQEKNEQKFLKRILAQTDLVNQMTPYELAQQYNFSDLANFLHKAQIALISN